MKTWLITVDHKGSLIAMDFVFTHQLSCSLHLFFVSFSSLFCCFRPPVWTHSHHSHQPGFQPQLFSAHKKKLFKPNKCYVPIAKWHIKLAPNWWILLSIWQPQRQAFPSGVGGNQKRVNIGIASIRSSETQLKLMLMLHCVCWMVKENCGLTCLL